MVLKRLYRVCVCTHTRVYNETLGICFRTVDGEGENGRSTHDTSVTMS